MNNIYNNYHCHNIIIFLIYLAISSIIKRLGLFFYFFFFRFGNRRYYMLKKSVPGFSHTIQCRLKRLFSLINHTLEVDIQLTLMDKIETLHKMFKRFCPNQISLFLFSIDNKVKDIPFNFFIHIISKLIFYV